MWKCKRCGSTKKSTHKDICHKCYMNDWVKKNSDKVNYIVKNYRKKNTEKRKVWNKVSRGKKSVKIEGLCEICKKRPAVLRHHPNYSKPYKVQLLCSQCHKDIHSPLVQEKSGARQKNWKGIVPSAPEDKPLKKEPEWMWDRYDREKKEGCGKFLFRTSESDIKCGDLWRDIFRLCPACSGEGK